MKPDQNQYRILIVEDNPGDQLLVEEYLTEHLLKVHVFQASTFKEFRQIYLNEHGNFNIILLDLSLPDISRENLIEEARKLSITNPVIILTGYGDLDFAVKALSLGVSDYLVKDTINALVLYKSILYAIERHRFVQSLKESEKRYMDLFHLSPAPLWVYDQASLAFLDVNESAIQHYGYSQHEFLALTLNQLWTDEGFDLFLTELKAGPGPRTLLSTYKHRKSNGDEIFVELSINAIHFKGLQATIVQASDVTEKLRHMTAIEIQNDRLRDIAWTQSHIVRAPVARLIGLIDLIKTGGLNEHEKEMYLGHVVSSAEEVDVIIKNIVDKSQSVIKD
jgi:PAS domain S-box-containing protein